MGIAVESGSAAVTAAAARAAIDAAARSETREVFIGF
jgi:hypothetical protein